MCQRDRQNGPGETVLGAPRGTFETLKNERRRVVLLVLVQADPTPVPLPELVDELAAWERGGSIDPDHRTAVYVSLYQSHLPRLEQFGMIDWDETGDAVTLTETGRTTAAYLTGAPERDSRWDRRFVCLSVVTGLFSGAVAWAAPDPTPLAGPLLVATTGSFLVAATAYYLEASRTSPTRFQVSGDS